MVGDGRCACIHAVMGAARAMTIPAQTPVVSVCKEQPKLTILPTMNRVTMLNAAPTE